MHEVASRYGVSLGSDKVAENILWSYTGYPMLSVEQTDAQLSLYFDGRTQ